MRLKNLLLSLFEQALCLLLVVTLPATTSAAIVNPDALQPRASTSTPAVAPDSGQATQQTIPSSPVVGARRSQATFRDATNPTSVPSSEPGKTLRISSTSDAPAESDLPASDSIAGPATHNSVGVPRQFVKGAIAGRALTFVPGSNSAHGPTFTANGAGFSLVLEKSGLSIVATHVKQPAASDDHSAKKGAGSAPWNSRLTKAVEVESSSVKIDFVGANSDATVEGLNPTSEKFNSFVGSDSSKWRKNVPTYSRVKYSNLYPGIDLVYYGEKARKLEYDLVVAPGADPDKIRLHVTGEDKATIDAEGALRLDGVSGHVSLKAPVLYQTSSSGKTMVAGKYVQLAENEFGFHHAAYDRSQPLVIDPTLNLLYSTYAGGVHDDESNAMVLDAQGNTYILGFAASEDFPVSGNAFQSFRKAIGTYTRDLVLLKFDASGNLLYSTFLGGTYDEYSSALVLDARGNAYISGSTNSQDFPVTPNALQSTYPGGASSGLLSEISPDGSALLYSSYIGGTAGNGGGSKLALNSSGQVIWMGSSGPGFPTTAGAYQQQIIAGTAVLIAVLDLTKSGNAQVVAATYYGSTTAPPASEFGQGNVGEAFVQDSAGNYWFSGQTYTNTLPTTANALQPTLQTLDPHCDGNGAHLNSAGYYAQLSADLTTLKYASYLSGQIEGSSIDDCAEFVDNIAIDPQGNLYVAGSTASDKFPVTTNALFPTTTSGGGYYGFTGFLTKLSPDGTKLLTSGYFGSNTGDTFPAQVSLDASGNVWVSGEAQSGSTNFPITSDAYQATSGGGYDGFLTELSSDETKVLYSTYFGAERDDSITAFAFDAGSNLHLTGNTSSTNFIVTPNAFQAQLAQGANNDGNDIFFALLGTGTIGTIGPLVGGNSGDTSITVNGAGFQTGATCSLIQGGITIASTSAVIATGGTTITCSFSLNGAQTGSYDVVVNNPDGSTLKKPSAFSVQTGGQPKIWSDIVGRPKIRTGSPSTYSLVYGNTGSVDAYFTLIWLYMPDNIKFTFPDGQQLPDGTNASAYSAQASYAGGSSTDPFNYIPILIPLIRAGQNYSLRFTITAPIDMPELPLTVYSHLPWADSYESANAQIAAAINSPSQLSTTCQPNAVKPYLNDCLGFWANEFAQGAANATQGTFVNGAATGLTPSGITPAAAQQTFLSGLQQSLNNAPSSSSGVQKIFIPTSNSQIHGQTLHALQTVPTPHPENPGIIIGVGVLLLMWWLSSLLPPSKTNCNNSTTGASYQCGIIEGPGSCYYSTCQDVFNGDGQLCYTNVVEGRVPCDPDPNLPKKPTSCQNFPKAPTYFQPLTVTSRNQMKQRQSMLSLLAPRTMDGGASGGGGCGGSGGAVDPNYKAGPTGSGTPSFYVPGTTPLNYTVGFENEATATLPAANVVVTDQLDPTKVDLTTLTLGTISFGTNVINLPQGTNNYNTTYKLNSALEVRIQGSLNPDTGLLKWTFTSIDPTTGLPPSDPTLGFLPPDTDGIVGQGSVVFNVMPKSAQPTGTTITNGASVVFDTNAAINTPTWLNTVDADLPVSKVAALPASESESGGNATFAVSWSGTDVGSGIANYSIWVSDNSAPYVLWQQGVKTTTANFTGASNHTYSFYSLAMDAAGNQEAAKTSPDTTTQVVAPATTTTLQASATTVLPGQPITLTATVAGPQGGTTVPTGSVTFFSGTASLGTGTLNVSGVATLAVVPPAGVDSITAQYAGDANFAPSTSVAITITVALVGTTTTVASSAATANLGASVTFTATVSPVAGGGTPTGTVTFNDGSTALGTSTLGVSGTATYSTTALTAGAHTITVVYSGDGTFAGSTSSGFTQTVTAPGYTLSANPATLTISRGQTGQVTFSVTPVGGFKSQVTFACSGLPAFTTCSFAPTSVTPDGTNTVVTSTLTIATDVKTASTTLPFRPGNAPAQDSETLLALMLLGLGALIRSRKRIGRNYGLRNLALAFGILLGISATATLGCGGSGSSSSTPRGNSTITVTATSGSTTQSATFTLTVQ